MALNVEDESVDGMITGSFSRAQDGEDEFLEAGIGFLVFPIGFGEVKIGNKTPKMSPSL
jgi:hypothetical protein